MVSAINNSNLNQKKCLLWYWGRRGGGCRYALEISKALHERNDVELFISISEQNELYSEFIKIGVNVHTVSTYYSRLTFILSLFRIHFVKRNFIKYLKKNDITKVISPMSHLWSPFILSIFKSTGVDLISTIHDPEPHLGEIITYPKFLIAQELRTAKYVICLSNFVADRISKLYNFPRDRISVCPHGAFTFGGDFAEDPETDESTSFKFLFFGRILPYKGLPMLLDAFHILCQEGLDVELVIAGNGDVKDFKDRLIDKRIKAEIRWVEENEIPTFYRQTDAVVLPYLEASQSGIWADAVGFKKPCIITPVDGLLEQVIDGQTGIVAEEVSADALASAMKKAMLPKTYEVLVSHLKTIDHKHEWVEAAETIVKRLG